MNHAPSVVKGSVRPHPVATAPNRIPYVYRADPVALDSLGLDMTARAVFVLLLDNARSKNWRSRLSNSTIGRILNRNPMTISRALGRLESRGLIRRDLIAGGRIRLSITIVWEGVRREDLTGQASVRRDGLTGQAQASNPLGAAVEQIQSSATQSERTDRPVSPSQGEERPPDGAAGADYLRRCVAAARRGEPLPEPPAGVTATKGYNPVVTPAPTPQPSPDATSAVVRGFVAELSRGLSLKDLRRPSRRW